jgi:serine protease Do
MTVRLTALVWFTLVASPLICCAQVGKDTTLWQWTSKSQHHDSIVQVACNGGTGTGVIVHVDKSESIHGGFKGQCLTAYHVVEDDNGKCEISVTYRNGRKAKNCRVLEFDKSADVAVLWVWIPEGFEAAPLATDNVKNGDSLEFCGLGGGSDLSCCLRHFSGVASMPSSEAKIFCDVPLLPGDSGGPVFNDKQEVVGIISGGWFWWDGGVKTSSGATLNATWPARAANVSPIKSLVQKAATSKASNNSPVQVANSKDENGSINR